MNAISADRPSATASERHSRFLIVTADDFGLDPAVNRAVSLAARTGILTAASLMVAAEAAAEAVQIARSLPGLRVGLHLVLTEGKPTLPPAEIPDLVGADGRFSDRMVFDSFRYCWSPRVRAQFRAEIRAQFQAFAATGLRLDHVNAHKHFHVHPFILRDVLTIGREFGMTALRVPAEPVWFAGNYNRTQYLSAALLGPWMKLMRRQIRKAAVACNDRVFGIACTGQLDERTLLAILGRLPAGVTEIYLHPAQTIAPITAAMAQYRHAEELAALLSPRVRAAVTASGAACGGYLDAFWA